MKKFRFSLDTVLGYKQQVLDSLRSEHAAALQRAAQQEAVVRALERRHQELNAEFRRAEKTGITVAEARSYEMGLRVLEGQIQRETERLEQLRREAEEKRLQVVSARQETASLEKLREKKLEGYRKAVQKSDERFIDELVLSERAASAEDAG